MIRQSLTKMELEATVTAMAERDFGSEIMIEIVEDLEYDEELDNLDSEYDEYDEYDGQPSEYDEWQDFYGGDDHYEHDCDCMSDY